MRLGVASAVITPPESVDIAGYGYYLDRTSTGVRDDLAATVLTFENEHGARAALCGVDLLSVDAETVAKVRQAVSAESRGELDQAVIMLNASHTHSGPGIRKLYGAGERSPQYIDQQLVPALASTIVRAFRSAADGEIGIDRAVADNLAYNRTGGSSNDQRVTTIRMDSDKHRLVGAHFACHPVVYGRNSTLISGDYPGQVRHMLQRTLQPDAVLWLTGSAGDIDPVVRKELGDTATPADAEKLGETIGRHAADMYDSLRLGSGRLRVDETTVYLPIDTAFELDPRVEEEAYREARGLSRTHNLDMLVQWLRRVAPVVNENSAESLEIPLTIVGIGHLVFVGLGAEVYNSTGLAIESDHPDLSIVTIMNSNEHQGYVPTADEYAKNSYGARSSSFIFGRKPLSPASEPVLRAETSAAIARLMAQP